MAVPDLTLLVSGLSGTQTPSGTLLVSLAGETAAGETVSISGETVISAAWNYSESLLRIPLNFSLGKGVAYTLAWDMRNGLLDQASPNITVSASGELFPPPPPPSVKDTHTHTLSFSLSLSRSLSL